MDERTMLERAARAAGIDAPYDEKWGGMLIPVTVQEPDDGYEFWNPLTDDGDALRLAVKLRLRILPGNAGVRADDANSVFFTEDFGSDAAAATRLAIVRAAAALDKTGESNVGR